jgi:hypothetical protein
MDPPVYEVTSADDYTDEDTPGDFTGTLRYVIEEQIGTGCGVINFNIETEDEETPVEINLKRRLVVLGSYVTILGQTQPGAGVEVTGDEFAVIDGHDIIIRYMRFRSGKNPSGSGFHCRRSLNLAGASNTLYNVILDHCSIGPSQDDNLSFYGPLCHCTVQWCIIGGGVYNASKAGIGSGGPDAFATDGITFCHNLITNTYGRQMEFGGPERVDFYNNVCTNYYYGTALLSFDGTHAPQINMLNNWYRTPNDNLYFDGENYFNDPISGVQAYDECLEPCGRINVPDNHNQFYLEGNVYERFDMVSDWDVTYAGENDTQWDFTLAPVKNGSMTANMDEDLQKSSAWSMWTSSDHSTDTEAAMGDVMDYAGCRLPLEFATPFVPGPLDSDDSTLHEAVDSGEVTFFLPSIIAHDLHPGRSTDPDPPAPYNAHSDVSTSTHTLSWKQSDEEVEYFKVYLRKDTDYSWTQIGGNVTAVGTGNVAEIEIFGGLEQSLEAHTIYLWHVDSYNYCHEDPNVGPTTGLEWSFRTQ